MNSQRQNNRATPKRPPISILLECFEFCSSGSLVWKERPASHFKRAGAARRVNREKIGTRAGCIGKDGYLLVRLTAYGESWFIPAHQIVWAMTHGEWALIEIDHMNGARDDNRPENLRLAERPQNMANMKPHKDNALGVKGVIAHQGKYRARICHRRKVYDLGCFDTIEGAQRAYQRKAIELNGEFAYEL